MEQVIVEMLKEICEKFPSNYQNVNLLEGGILDSLGIISFISASEDRLGIEIDIDDVTPENFGTVKGIVELITKYKESEDK